MRNPAQLSEFPAKQVLDHAEKPTGVISHRAQQYLFVGIAVVIVLISMFSSNRRPKTPANNDASTLPRLEDSDHKKVIDYAAELTAEQRAVERARRAQQTNHDTAQARVESGNPASGNPARTENSSASVAAGEGDTAASPDPLEQRERERSYNARFASNLTFPGAQIRDVSPTTASAKHPEPEAIPADTAPLAKANETTQNKRPEKVDVNAAAGPPYVLFEGTVIETALVNRLDGDFSGPVKVMVTNPVFSHDHQHVLIPDGTFALGEVKRVQGFGQRRLAVAFDRLLMPDGYSVDLDQFQGLNQTGETGLKDQVNNHYMQIFGASIALGVIAGAAESSVGTVGIGESGNEAYRAGMAGSLSQSSTRVLDRFLNINPTITIREGQRIKVYLTNDLLLPAYENHRVPPNI